jgi:Tfp pilus assembly protein PilN
MIQFNLLPDVKAEYVHAKRQQRTIMVLAGLVTAITVLIFLLLLVVVDGVQKHNLNNLTKQVSQDNAKLQQTPDLNQILTVQNQLESLPALHNQKPVASRLFRYISEVTPAAVTISELKVDFGGHSITINGEAPTLDVVNTFDDTLKFTTYTISGQTTKPADAFSEVVLSSFGRDSRGATYTITVNFAPQIFNETDSAQLTVPDITSTRSVIDQPQALFQKSADSSSGT